MNSTHLYFCPPVCTPFNPRLSPLETRAPEDIPLLELAASEKFSSSSPKTLSRERSFHEENIFASSGPKKPYYAYQFPHGPSALNKIAFLKSEAHLKKIASVSRRIGSLVKQPPPFLDENFLSSLPPQIGSLSRLKVLSAEHNKIRALPVELFACKALRKLNLESNFIQELPPQIEQLTKLKELFVPWDPLHSLPTEIANTHIKVLHLNDNDIQTIPEKFLKRSSLKKTPLKIKEHSTPTLHSTPCDDPSRSLQVRRHQIMRNSFSQMCGWL